MSALRLWMLMAMGGSAWTLAEPGLAALPVASALGGVSVEVPQIQFLDAVVSEQFQFLDKVMVGLVLCNDGCRCSLGCSTLTSVDVLVWCSGRSATWCCSAQCLARQRIHVLRQLLGALPFCSHFFYVKGNSDLEVVFVLLSDGWVCESR